MSRICRFSPAVFFLVLSCKTTNPGATSQVQNEAAPPREVSSSHQSIRKITLEGPFHHLIYNRSLDLFEPEKLEFEASYRDVKVTYENQTFDATVRLRGGIRFCTSFPQIKLKLPKTHPLEGQREFKIITHATYALDPNVPFNAPQCGNESWSSNLEGEHQQENLFYDLSAAMLPFHLKNMKFDVRYVDPDHSIDLTERAYFIEDKDAAAKRYRMKTASVEGVSGVAGWRDRDEASVLEEVQFYDFSVYLAEVYARLKNENPTWTPIEISKVLNASEMPLAEKKAEEWKAKNLPRKAEILKKLKDEQLSILKSFDQASLVQAILFNMMIKSTDWDVFAINSHGKSIKNVELLQDEQKRIYTIPYDFNESFLINGQSVGNKDEYKRRLQEFVADMRKNLDGFLIAELKKQIPFFLKAIDEHAKKPEYINFRESITNFEAALKEFGSTL